MATFWKRNGNGKSKGNLDEAALNYLENKIDPILIRAKFCSSSHIRDSCYGNKVMFCMQSNSLSCNLRIVMQKSGKVDANTQLSRQRAKEKQQPSYL